MSAVQSGPIVIIGGGVIGSAIAYFLTLKQPGCEVVVIERDPTYARASSALSASSIRQQFSTDINIQISAFGIGFLRNVGQLLACHGDMPDIGLHEGGYLYLATQAGEATLRENHVLQKQHGADVALLGPQQLAERGFSPAELAQVTCPIGVPGIHGKQPEVIAVAVAAQLLQTLTP